MLGQRFFFVLLVLAGLAPASFATTYNAVVVYGDSLSDNGNLFAASGQPGAPYYNGRRSNGPVAVEYLANSLGAPLVDLAWIGATTGVGNYADGGSVTGFGSFGLPGMSAVYAGTQASIAPYLGSSLFVVWGGPNDLLAPSPLDGDAAAIIARAVANEVAIIADLKAAGAKGILAPGMFDLGLTPDFIAQGPAAILAATAFTDAFNAALVAALPSGVLYFDTAALMRDVIANPAAYGFTNAADPCYNGVTVCASPGQYVFFDAFHPTTAAHAIVAQGFLSAIPEPATWLLLGAGLFAWRRRAA